MRPTGSPDPDKALRDDDLQKALDAALESAYRNDPVDLDYGRDPLDPRQRRPTSPVAPAMLPKQRRGFLRRHAGLLLAVAAIALAAGGTVLKIGVEPIVVAGEGFLRLLHEGPAQRPKIVTEEIEPARLPDPLGALPPEIQAVLIDKTPAPQVSPFRAAMIASPDAVCKALGKAGLPNFGWLPLMEGSPVYECLSELVPISNPEISAALAALPPEPAPVAAPEAGEAVEGETAAAFVEPEETQPARPKLSTFFFSARGKRDRIEAIRFKLNLDDPSVRGKALDMLLGYVDRIAPIIAWSRPEDLKKALQDGKRLSGSSRGVLYQVLPEAGPVTRLNVVLLITEPADLPKPGLTVAAVPEPVTMTPVDPAASLPVAQGVTPAFSDAQKPGSTFDAAAAPADLPDGAVGPLSPVTSMPLPTLGGEGEPPAEATAPAVANLPAPSEPADAGVLPVATDPVSPAPAPVEAAVAPAEPVPAAGTPTPVIGEQGELPATATALAPDAGTVPAVEEIFAPVPPVLPPRRPASPPPAVAAVAPSPAPAAPAAAPVSVQPQALPLPQLEELPGVTPVPAPAATAQPAAPTRPRALPLPQLEEAPPATATAQPPAVTGPDTFTLPVLDGSGDAPGLPGVNF
ncbi:DUF6030 family protein [Chthonobacter albigriseus]|uniref:DUF6030 family protein n=1 Tax=Chthonobacter albigriseus TaxID=1683161 RepID=UPI0015EF6C76|nr:DUF6030 family protein [Chthonobacter albigriseus]